MEADGTDPELLYLKSTYRNEFQQALVDQDPAWRQVIIRYRIHTTQV